jgi:hypothetical protein
LPGETKRLLRRSLHDRLPPPVLARRPTTSLLALARRGLRERAAPLIRQVLEEPDTIWSRYVHSDWLWTHGMQALDRPRPGMDGLVLWHCYALERWRRALASDLATAPEIG